MLLTKWIHLVYNNLPDICYSIVAVCGKLLPVLQLEKCLLLFGGMCDMVSVYIITVS